MKERQFLVAIEGYTSLGTRIAGNIRFCTNGPITFEAMDKLKAEYCQNVTLAGTPFDPENTVIVAMIPMD